MLKQMPKFYSKSQNVKNQVEWCCRPTIYNSYKLITDNFEYALKVQIDRIQPQYFISTEVDRNTPLRQVSSGTRMVHQQRHMPSGKNKLEILPN